MVPAPPTTDPAKSSTWTAATVVLVARSMASMMEWGSASRPIHVALLKMVNSLGCLEWTVSMRWRRGIAVGLARSGSTA